MPTRAVVSYPASHSRRRARWCVGLVVTWLLGGGRCLGAMHTTTTSYTYNADGAPTAVTTRVGSAPATTTYLAWDNFVPDTGAPATGTVRAANGNLLGLGPDARFTYDVRDRLTACSAAGDAASYAYHPASLMKSSTLGSGDALQFYYDNGAAPRMVHAAQPSTGATASFLGPLRYLSDGSQQILFTPRKDIAGLYDAAAQSLAPYHYDPYGASQGLGGSGSGVGGKAIDPPRSPLTPNPSTPHPVSTYDLSANPFQYAGEYRDPTCATYYLRARWYLPAHQTFLSRDRGDGLHRYGYTAGNPIGRTDPTGLRYTGVDFSRDVGALVHRLTPGIGANLEPLTPVWGQVLGGMELAGLLPSFWHRPTTQGYVTFGFLAASMAGEVGALWKPLDRALASDVGPSLGAFGVRQGFDVALGGGQSVAQSYRHGRVDVASLVQGADTTLAGIFWARFGAGIGYRPFGLSLGDVDRSTAEFFRQGANPDRALVYRVRYNSPRAFTTPWMELFHLGNYHEAVLALTDDEVWHAQVNYDGGYTWEIAWSRNAGDRIPSTYLQGKTEKVLIFAGSARRDAVEGAFHSELGAFQDMNSRQQAGIAGFTMDRNSIGDYSKLTNNCQQHAARVRANVATFDRHSGAIEDVGDE